MSKQYIICVSGEIGAGKSYITKKLIEMATAKGIKAHHLDLDIITHEILRDLPQPKYQEIRSIIVDEFGAQVKNADGSINRKILGELVFNDKQKLERLNQIMMQPLLVRIRRVLYGKKGLIFFNSALIVEAGMTYLANNNVCLVKTDKISQKQRLLNRDLTELQIKRRLKSQYTYSQKKLYLNRLIKKENFGQIWEVDNSQKGTDQVLAREFNKILKHFNLQ